MEVLGWLAERKRKRERERERVLSFVQTATLSSNTEIIKCKFITFGTVKQ